MTNETKPQAAGPVTAISDHTAERIWMPGSDRQVHLVDGRGKHPVLGVAFLNGQTLPLRDPNSLFRRQRAAAIRGLHRA